MAISSVHLQNVFIFSNCSSVPWTLTPLPLRPVVSLSVSTNLETRGPHMSGVVQDLTFRVWPVSLSITSCRCAPPVAGVSMSFLFEPEESSVGRGEGSLCSFALTVRSLRSHMKS